MRDYGNNRGGSKVEVDAMKGIVGGVISLHEEDEISTNGLWACGGRDGILGTQLVLRQRKRG